MAFGNSDGDLAMVRYTSLNSKYKSFTGLVRHDDESREFAYDRESKTVSYTHLTLPTKA